MEEEIAPRVIPNTSFSDAIDVPLKILIILSAASNKTTRMNQTSSQ